MEDIQSQFTFKQGANKPLLLWCSSHTTLSHEEIPLYLQAGFRIIPLLTDMWTFGVRKSLDSELCGDWKFTVGLPADIVRRIQAIPIYENSGVNPISSADIDLLNKYVDIAYLTVLPNLAVRLTECFNGSVVFRPFGHGVLNTYSRIAKDLGADISTLSTSNKYVWCPILSTLQDAEEPPMWSNPVHVGCFVTPSRLVSEPWVAKNTKRLVVETIPRINKQTYYLDIFRKYASDFGKLPIRILGGNEVSGGKLQDTRIVGTLNDEEYYREISTARISIYHGTSPFHLHYHPLEYMTVGVPVLFHVDSAIAAETRAFGLSEAELKELGMYRTAPEAVRLARAALDDIAIADDLSQRQKFIMREVYSRDKVLQQARWLRVVCTSQIKSLNKIPDTIKISETIQPEISTPAAIVKPWYRRMQKEIKRVAKKLRTTRTTEQDHFTKAA